MADENDEESELEMSERQRQVLERGGDLEVSDDVQERVDEVLDEDDDTGHSLSIEIPDEVADELDLEDGDDVLWSGENAGDED